MIIKRLDIEGFRAFNERHSFDLSHDVVLLKGPNGHGKTSLLDAILWAFTGELSRLERDDAGLESPPQSPIVSLYSKQERARVELELVDPVGNKQVKITRSLQLRSDGQKPRERSKVEIESGDDEVGPFVNDAADSWLVNTLWSEAQYAENPSKALVRALTRSLYLQQDRVRQFVETDDSNKRFKAVSELVGAGRIDDLRDDLRSDRDSWMSDTRNLVDERDELAGTVKQLQEEYEEIGPPTGMTFDELEDEWNLWWEKAGELGVEREKPAVDDSTADTALDEAVKQLSTLRREQSRQQSDLQDFLGEVQQHADDPELPDLDQLHEDLEQAQEEKSDIEGKLAKTKKEAAERRKEQVRDQEESEELAALADIALRHIDGPCPVCQQEHPVEETRAHLKELIRRSGRSPSAEEEGTEVEDLTEKLEEKTNEVTEKEQKLEDAKQKHKRRERWVENRNKRLEELHILSSDFEKDAEDLQGHEIQQVLERKIEILSESVSKIKRHIEDGEELAVDLSSIGRESRRKNLQDKIDEKKESMDELNETISMRKETSERAMSLIKKLRDAATEVISSKLDEVRPLLRNIYSKVDPHPTLRDIRLKSKFSYQLGRLNSFVEDPEDPSLENQNLDPFNFMSSSQVNIVALSIFLAMNLGLKTIPIDMLILDDPLQSLDDINLLGFIDLIRRIREERQIFVSTHDSRLASLFENKLRPAKKTENTSVISFIDWTRKGPKIKMYDLPRPEEPKRLVTA